MESLFRMPARRSLWPGKSFSSTFHHTIIEYLPIRLPGSLASAAAIGHQLLNRQAYDYFCFLLWNVGSSSKWTERWRYTNAWGDPSSPDCYQTSFIFRSYVRDTHILTVIPKVNLYTFTHFSAFFLFTSFFCDIYLDRVYMFLVQRFCRSVVVPGQHCATPDFSPRILVSVYAVIA